MAKNYTHKDMDYLKLGMYWATADYTDRYDYILRRPIHNMPMVRKYFIDAVTTFARDAADPIKAEEQYHYEYEIEFIAHIESRGEDVGRILNWLRSMDDHGTQDDTIYAYFYWKNYFNEAAQQRFTPVANDKILELVQSYKTDVYEPYDQFYWKESACSKIWIEKPETRTEYDNFLQKYFYGIGESTPGNFFYKYVENIYFRRWWRQYRGLLNKQEKELLYNDLINFLQNPEVSDIDVIQWDYIAPIDEAIDIDNIPNFELYAAPAQ